MAQKTILVTGATGQQGGATARHLLARGYQVRALTRDTGKPAAQALADQGADVVTGNLNDRATLEPALDGVAGVFSVQNFWESGAEGEIQQGITLTDAAQAAGVKHLVYTSVGGAERHTGITHFDSKAQVERHLQASGVPFTILRPVFFMENFLHFMGPQEQDGVLTFTMALPPDRALQMIAVDDIGALAALAFDQSDRFMGQAIEIAGDELTMSQVAETWGRVVGKPARFVELPIEALRQYNAESAVMFEWFNTHGYIADIPAVRALHPGLKDFETWLRQSLGA